MKINVPTKITISRIVVIALMIISFIVLEILGLNGIINSDFTSIVVFDGYKINLIYIILAVVFLLASFTDFLDGYLARKNNQVTTLGKFLDPIADKLLVNSTIIFLCIKHSYVDGSQMVFPFVCAILIIARDTIVDALRFIAASKGAVLAANIFGKAKTVAEMITIPFVLLNDLPFKLMYPNGNIPYINATYFLIYITTFLSLLSGFIYVYQNKGVFSSDEKK